MVYLIVNHNPEYVGLSDSLNITKDNPFIRKWVGATFTDDKVHVTVKNSEGIICFISPYNSTCVIGMDGLIS